MPSITDLMKSDTPSDSDAPASDTPASGDISNFVGKTLAYKDKLAEMILGDKKKRLSKGQLQEKYPRTSYMRQHKAEEQQREVYEAELAAHGALRRAVDDYERVVGPRKGAPTEDLSQFHELRNNWYWARQNRTTFDRNHQPLLKRQDEARETMPRGEIDPSTGTERYRIMTTGEMFPRMSPTFPKPWSTRDERFENQMVKEDLESLGGPPAGEPTQGKQAKNKK